MARPLRLEFPGALWHVLNRGVERRTIYLDDADRRAFLRLLQQSVTKSRWQLHAYVLMSNHYHLLFQTPEPTLSKGMKDLDGDYACYFNRRHSRTGHLFQGRFKSHLVDSESYMLEVARYVVLNPVRAFMVPAAGEWRWSSYRATAGLAAVPSWLDPGPILDRFHPADRVRACAEYRDYIAAGGERESPWKNLVAQMLLGGAEFLEKMEERVRARTLSREHSVAQRRFRAQTLDGIRTALDEVCGGDSARPTRLARAAFVVLAERHTTSTNAEAGRRLGITGQAAGKLLRKSRERLESDPLLASLVEEVETMLSDRSRFRVST